MVMFMFPFIYLFIHLSLSLYLSVCVRVCQFYFPVSSFVIPASACFCSFFNSTFGVSFLLLVVLAILVLVLADVVLVPLVLAVLVVLVLVVLVLVGPVVRFFLVALLDVSHRQRDGHDD
jgi:hypothetical protein